MKEIENYLIAPSAIAAAINSGIRRKAIKTSSVTCDAQSVGAKLMEITDSLETETRSQYAARKSDYLRKVGDKRDMATVLMEASAWFDKEWKTLGVCRE